MQTYTQKLLERLRKIADPPTDYQMAKMLGVERQNVHNWLKRGSGMDLVTAYTLADLLHEDRSIIEGFRLVHDELCVPEGWTIEPGELRALPIRYQQLSHLERLFELQAERVQL